MVVFFSTLGFACIDPYFFIGYLISMALFGLYQAIFMANAGGAWDNAKKVVETELRAKGTELHAAYRRRRHRRRPVQGHVVGRAEPGDQVHHAVRRARGRPRARAAREGYDTGRIAVAVLISMVFAWRSFYGMRIQGTSPRWRRAAPSLASSALACWRRQTSRAGVASSSERHAIARCGMRSAIGSRGPRAANGRANATA